MRHTPLPAREPADLLIPSEVREKLHISDRTLYRYAARGVLRPVKLPGGGRRFRRVDVDELVGVDQVAEPDRCTVCDGPHTLANCPQERLI